MRSRRPQLVEGVVVVTLFALGAALLMGSVAVAPSERVYGLPSDPLGEVWRLAQFDRGDIDLLGNDVSHQANQPSGVELRRPADASQVLYDAPAALLARAIGPIRAYNFLVFLAFWTAALAAYGAMRWLRVGPAGSALAAVLFTLAPVHIVEAQLHVALALVFMLPVLAVLGIRALETPSRARGASFGAALGLCGYITGYLVLEAGVLAAGVGAAALVLAVRDAGARRPLLVAVGAALLTAVLVLMPLLVIEALYGGKLAPGLDRPLSDVAAFSSRPGSYVDMASTSYIGLAGLSLAVGGLAATQFSAVARATLLAVGLAGFLVSLRPELVVAGVEVPMPSKLVHAIVPYWRVFGRVGIVAALAVAFLAGVCVDRLRMSRRPYVRVAAVAAAVLAVADVVERPPEPAGDLGRSDNVAAGLQNGRGTVAEYPLWGFDNYRFGPYLFRQLRHGRPLFNGSLDGTVAADLAAAAGAPDAPEAREALSLAKVRSVVVHEGSPRPPAVGFRRQREVGGDGAIYALIPIRDPAIVRAQGAYDLEAGPDRSPFQWLGAAARLRLVAEAPLVTVRFDAVSPEVPRRVRFGSRLVDVSTAPTPVRLCIRNRQGSVTIPISTVPAARRLPGGDPRVSGLGVFHLRADPGCGAPAG
jgi:hypothetical protein